MLLETLYGYSRALTEFYTDGRYRQLRYTLPKWISRSGPKCSVFWKLQSDTETMTMRFFDSIKKLSRRNKVINGTDWLYMLIRSQTNPSLSSPFGDPLPGFPSEELQRNTTSLYGEAALRQAYAFYRDIMGVIDSQGDAIERSWNILDFGACWGRISRFFLRDIPLDNLYGLDVEQCFVDEIRGLFRGGHFDTCDSLPPCKLEDSSMNLISAYSVFSHLSEKAFIAWMHEFHRLLRPGGILALTTRNEGFLDYCGSLKSSSEELAVHNAALTSMVADIDTTKAQYRDGEFVFFATRGDRSEDGSFYGEAFVPKQYVESTLSGLFDIMTFSPNNDGYGQALFVLKSR